MASRQLAATKAAHERREADTRKAAEVAQRFCGWHVFSSRDARMRLATRMGHPPDPGDGVWAASLIADDWTGLEEQLAEQVRHDAARTLGVQP
jgi:hypothetical protein